jgi:sodium-dependent phosphate transporter
MVLSDYTYVFVIGTFFAMLDAYNNGASTFILTSTPPASMHTNVYRRCGQCMGY